MAFSEIIKLATESYKRFSQALNEVAKIAESENKLRAITGYKNSEIIKYYSAEISKRSAFTYADLIQTACEELLKGKQPENIIEGFEKELIKRSG